MKHIKTIFKDSLFEKLAALFLALFMLFSVFICTTLAETGAETESERPNLIKNGGFDDTETLETDWVLKLGDFVAEGSTGFFVTDEMKDSYEGSDYALKFLSAENKNVFHLKKKLTTPQMIPGATYELSYRIYAVDLGNRKDTGLVGCELDFYKENKENDVSVHISGTEIAYTESTTNGRWATISGTFVFPADAKMLRILVRNRAVGTVYFDDISLKMVDAEMFEYSTSHVFHYTSEEHGTAKVSIFPYFQTGENKLDEKAHYVNFGIYDGEMRLTGQNVTFENFEASYTYSVDSLKVLKKKYTLKISVFKENEEIDSYAQSLYKYERPKFLDEDGNFRNKWGEIVKPFNAWHMTEENLDEAAKAGFTMFTMSRECRKPENEISTVSLLTTAEQEGLIGLFTLYGEDGEWPVGYEARTLKDGEDKAKKDDEKKAETKAIVEKYANDKRFLGWVVKDEPLGGGITEERKALLEESYKFIRDLDPNHPIILTDYNRGVFKETLKYCDIFMPNSYGKGYDGVRIYVEEAIKHAHGRPVYPNIAAYTDKTIDQLPTGQQMQHFMHQAFLAGAKGVSVYSFNNSVSNEKERIPIFDTPLWGPLVDTGNTEVPVLFDLFVYGKETPECKEEPGKYVQRKWTRQDGDYYFLMSVSNEEQTVEYEIDDGKAVKLLGGDSTSYFTLSQGKLSVSLKGGDGDNSNKVGDVLMFKVFDASNEAMITLNGIGIKVMQGDKNLTYKAPPGAAEFVVALYKEENGIEKLYWVQWYKGESTARDLITIAQQYEITAKVFAWDSSLRPLGNAAVVPPHPRQ